MLCKTTFFNIWKPVRPRYAYLALLYISYCMGLWNCILEHYIHTDIYVYLHAMCCVLGCVLSIALMHFVRHKIIIGISEILKCIFVCGAFVPDLYWGENVKISFVVWEFVCQIETDRVRDIFASAIRLGLGARLARPLLKGTWFFTARNVNRFVFFDRTCLAPETDPASFNL